MTDAVITATLAARAAKCLHSWSLECHGDPTEFVEPDAGTKLMWERGLAHERARIAELDDVVEPVWDGSDWPAGAAATLQLMRDGQPWIYQAVLIGDGTAGQPDLLERVEESSDLGEHTYVPVDIKGHKSVERGDRIQLVTYANLLEPLLGRRPTLGRIWLNTGVLEDVDLGRDEADVEALLGEMRQVRSGEVATKGHRCTACATCPWSPHCAATWAAEEDVGLIYGVTAAKAKKLNAGGYHTCRDVADSDAADIASATGIGVGQVQEHRLHALARARGAPFLRKPLPPIPDPVCYYDIETYGSCTYLHGVIEVRAGIAIERQFVAREPTEDAEEVAWHQTLEFFAEQPDAIIYCWTFYERRFARTLFDRFGGNADGWRRLDTRLVDQCALVKGHLVLPTSGYGIKHVAPLFGFGWDAEDAGGLNSEAWYHEWIEEGDEALFEKILLYNRNDVEAMKAIDDALAASSFEPVPS